MAASISKFNLPECWIHRKRRFILESQTSHESLPYVTLEYERILKAHNIPYRKTTRFDIFSEEEVLEFWNPEVGLEEEDLTLPLYAAMSDYSYQPCYKYHTEKFPTAKCIKAAKETEVFINDKINEYDQILREVRHYRFAKEKLADGVVTVCFSDITPYVHYYDIEMNHDHFKIFRIPKDIGSDSDWVVIFNMNKVARNGYLTIQVPKRIAGFAIGKNGGNLYFMKEMLGVKKITVIPI